MADSLDQLLENRDFLDSLSMMNDDYGQIIDPKLIEEAKKQAEWLKPFPCTNCGKIMSKKDTGIFFENTVCTACFFHGDDNE